MMKRLKFFTLAALLVLPLTACDEGDDIVTPPAVSGTITGSVTVDGQGAANVNVALSNGQNAATDASGRYTFSSVPAGAYTVAISGVPAGTTFDALSKAAVISTSGQVVTVDFSGQSIRTSAITGSVTNGGQPLAGVTVALSGTSTGSTTTSTSGQFSFGGLRAGSYTVTISGLPSGVNCAETSRAVVLGTGEAQIVSFGCGATGTGNATISGRLFLDENPKNDTFDGAALEENLKASNVSILIEGPSIGTVDTVQTDANGMFTAANKAPGTYNVTLVTSDPDIPSGVAFGGTSATTTITVGAGATAPVNFPFDIVSQIVNVYAFLGRDADATGISTTIGTGVAPVKGVILDLYPTEADAIALTNRLDRDTTDVNGEVQFDFKRVDDTAPGVGTDRIVFATFVSAPPFHTLNGEARFEIQYAGTKSVDMAPDTFDLLNERVTLGFDALRTKTREPLVGWNAALFRNDTSAPAIQSKQTDSKGRVLFTETTNLGAVPDTFFMRLSGAQPQAGNKAFTQTPEAEEQATVVTRYLRVIHNGTVPDIDTVDAGNEIVKFAQADLLVRAYHEQDDTAYLTAGDDFQNVDNLRISLYRNGTLVETKTPQSSDGAVTFQNLIVDSTYTVRARSSVSDQVIVTDTTVAIQALDGSSPAIYQCPLGADAFGTPSSCATFAFKYNDGGVIGRVKTADSTAVAGAKVRVQRGSPFIGDAAGKFVKDTTVTTNSTGNFAVTGLLEGPYIVSVVDSITSSGDTIFTVFAPNNRADTVDIQGNSDVDIVGFTVTRGDTEIRGVVVNDRDNDTNTIDPGEALENVTISLYRDNSGAVTLSNDSLIATTTTDAAGRYTFAGLFEGNYIIKASSTANAVVLRRFDAAGAVVDTAVTQTSGNPLVRGTTSPVPLPRWNYNTSEAENVGRTHFTFLFSNTEARGTVTAGGTPKSGETVRLRRCDDSAGSTSPPAAGTCTTYFTGFVAQTRTTGADGTFSFANLQEGVYEVDVTSSGSTPTSRLFLLVGSGDIETGDFTIP